MSKKKKKKKESSDTKLTNELVQRMLQDMEERIKEVDAVDHNTHALGRYSLHTILKRSLKSYVDNLKPVQRKLMLSLYYLKVFKSPVKSSEIIGETLKDHPHGDGAVYGAMVQMTQDHRNAYNLIDGEGNYGSVSNPTSFAAHRYTEVMMSQFGYDAYFKNWGVTKSDFNTDMSIDYEPKTNGKYRIPSYLPCKYPLFLTNWHSAFGSGKSTMSPGFNMEEAFDVVIELIKDPKAKITKWYPDDVMGCDICNKSELKNMIDQSRVKIVVRSTWEDYEENGRLYIDIDSVPYQVNPTTLLGSIKTAYKAGKLPELLNSEITSDDNGSTFAITLEYRKGYDPKNIMEKIFKMTSAQTSFTTNYNFVEDLSVVKATPRELILKWIDFRLDTIRRIGTIKLLETIKRRTHLEALIDIIETGKVKKIIEIISSEEDDEAAKVTVMKKYGFSEYQFNCILNLGFKGLTPKKYRSYVKDRQEIDDSLPEMEAIATDVEMRKLVIISELMEVVEKYGQPRRSKVKNMNSELVISDTNHYVIVSPSYIKKVPHDPMTFKVGRMDENKVVAAKVVNNRDTLVIFDKEGNVYPIPMDKISDCLHTSYGSGLNALGIKSQIVAAIPMSEMMDEKSFIHTVTKNGQIMTCSIKEVVELTPKKYVWMKLDDGDTIMDVKISKAEDELIIYSADNKCVIFPADDCQATKKRAKGNIGMKSDCVLGLGVIKLPKTEKGKVSHKEKHILVVTDRGKAKLVERKMFPDAKRGTKGTALKLGGTPVYVGGWRKLAIQCLLTNGIHEFDPNGISATKRIGKVEKIIDDLDKKHSVVAVEFVQR